MISEDEINAAVAILDRAAQPERVILFGSYARGKAKPDSDA
jgi:predicted nucleotidyltransferase